MNIRKPAGRTFPARALALAGAALLLSTCQDFFGTADLKQQIKDDVIDATAAEVAVYISPPSDSSMGAPSPVGNQTWKVGVPYTITTSVGDKYAFAGWTAGAGDVTFSAPDAATTTVTINADYAGTITVTPAYDTRPKCIYWSPKSTGEFLNSDIFFRFSEDIDPASIVLGDTVRVTTWEAGSGDAETPIDDYFQAPVPGAGIDGPSVTLSLKPGYLYSSFYTVYITLTTGIRDPDGNGMADEHSWSFDTGNGTDVNSPAINSFEIHNQARIEFAGGTAHSASAQIQVNVSASDDDGVRWLRIIETPCDSSGTLLPGYSTTIHPSTSYSNSVDFTLASTDYEWTKITVQVADPSGNWSSAAESATNTKLVRLDTAPPAAPSITSASPNALTGGTYWYRTGGVTFTLSSDDGTGSGILGYTTDSNASDGFSPYPVANPVLSASAGLYAVDNAGNVSGVLDLTVQQDSTAPASCTLVSTTADYPSGTGATTYYDQSASVSFGFGGSDTQSGLAGYTTDSSGLSPAPTLLELSIPAGSTSTIYAVDKVGNVRTGPTLTVKRDYTAPTIDSVASSNQDYVSGTAPKTYWVDTAGKTVTFTLTVTDTLDGSAAGSGISAVNYSGTASGTLSAAPYSATLSAGTYAFTARDNVGNVSAATTVIVKEDTYATPPTVTTSNSYDDPGSNTFWVKGSGTQASLTPAAVDYAEAAQSTAGCGIASYHYSTHSNLSSPVTVSGSVSLGAGTYYFFTRDLAGNQSSGVTITVSADTALPGTPTCTATGTYTTYTGSGIKWYAYSDAAVPTFTVSSTDSAPSSGIAGFSSDGTTTVIPGLSNGGAITLGTTASSYYGVDNVGYVSTAYLRVARDRTAPGMTVTGTADFLQGTTYWVDTAAETVTFTVTVSADTSDGTNPGSGVKRVYYGSTTLGTAAGTFTPALGSGTYTLCAEDQVVNKNESPVTVAEDTTNPTITGAALTATATTVSGFTTTDPVTSSGLDTGSYAVTLHGTATSAGSFDGSTMTISSGAPAAEGHTDYDIYVEDNVGHGTTVTVRLSRDASDNYTAAIQ